MLLPDPRSPPPPKSNYFFINARRRPLGSSSTCAASASRGCVSGRAYVPRNPRLKMRHPLQSYALEEVMTAKARRSFGASSARRINMNINLDPAPTRSLPLPFDRRPNSTLPSFLLPRDPFHCNLSLELPLPFSRASILHVSLVSPSPLSTPKSDYCQLCVHRSSSSPHFHLILSCFSLIKQPPPLSSSLCHPPTHKGNL